MPSYVVLYSSKKVTPSTVTIVGKVLVVAVASSVRIVVRAPFVVVTSSVCVVVRMLVAVLVIVVGTCSTMTSMT